MNWFRRGEHAIFMCTQSPSNFAVNNDVIIAFTRVSIVHHDPTKWASNGVWWSRCQWVRGCCSVQFFSTLLLIATNVFLFLWHHGLKLQGLLKIKSIVVSLLCFKLQSMPRTSSPHPIEPPITDPPISGQPLYSRQMLCYGLKLLYY